MEERKVRSGEPGVMGTCSREESWLMSNVKNPTQERVVANTCNQMMMMMMMIMMMTLMEMMMTMILITMMMMMMITIKMILSLHEIHE